MYVILTQDVPKVGQKNALVDVSEGYFMNFLHPRKLAKSATESQLESLKGQIVEQKQVAAQAAQSQEQHAQQLQGAELKLSGKASDKGTLFQAITEKDVAAEIKKMFKFDVPESSIEMEHLKRLGEHTVKVSFGSQSVSVKLVLEATE